MATSAKFDGKVINHLASGDISSGDVVEYGTDGAGFCGVALKDIADTEYGPVDQVHVFEVAKTTGGGTGWAHGALIYWTGSASTKTAGSDHLMGTAWGAAADADAVANVKMGG